MNFLNKNNPHNIELILPIYNSKATRLNLILEPLCEFFMVDSEAHVSVHAIVDKRTAISFFEIELKDDCMIIYLPGGLSDLCDFFILKDGVKISPIERFS